MNKMTANIKVWSVPSISDAKILPDTAAPENPTVEFATRACRGQYVPFSFCVRSEEPLVGLIAETTCPDGWKIDKRYVKCWWQSGHHTFEHGDQPVFTPELLLHDPGVVEVDMEAKRNIIRRPVQDAVKLQPICLQPNTTQQYWITIKVPENARAEKYVLHVRLRSRNVLLDTLPIKIEVLPFELEQPSMNYGIFYQGVLGNAEPQAATIPKTSVQYAAEMENMRAHGIVSPTFNQPMDEWFEDAIKIRKWAGIKVDPLYCCGWPGIACLRPGNKTPQTEIELRDYKIQVLEKRVRAAHLGIRDVYWYGRDEASGDRLLSQRETWQATHEAGGFIYAASGGSNDLLETMGDLCDVAVEVRRQAVQIEKWHELGSRSWLYSWPNVITENPAVYRRNYGPWMLAAGWGGCLPWAYQHGKDDIWDDFDHPTHRDMVFAYPTIDRPIDTRQWEGWREAVTDARYAATLEKLGGTLPEIKGRDGDVVRAETTDRILVLMNE